MKSSNLFFSPTSVGVALLLLMVTWPCAVHAQASAAPPPQMPKDAKGLLLLAAKTNGLADTDMRPWHLKVSYTSFDDNGAASSQGSLEEWWAGPLKVKRIQTGPGFSQTTYKLESGTFRVGAQTAISSSTSQLAGQFETPVPVDSKQVDGLILDQKQVKKGDMSLTCVRELGFRVEGQDRRMVGPVYCLDRDKPVLRAVITNPVDSVEVIRSDLRVFQRRYVPGELTVVKGGKTEMRARLDVLEPMDPVDESVFALPAEAKAVPMRISISAGVAAGMLVKKSTPAYPEAAKSKRVSGTVSFEVVIGKDGHVTDARVVSGPEVLREASRDALMKWQYRPYLLNGQPVEVLTTVNIVFSIG